MDFMLKQLLIVLVLLAVTPYIVGIVLALLAKLRLLPLAVCGLVLSCLPNWPSGSLRPIPHCLLDAQIHPLETGGAVLRPFPAGNGQTAVCPSGV